MADSTAPVRDADLEDLRLLLAFVEVARDHLTAALASRCLGEAGRALARELLQDPSIESLREALGGLLGEVEEATRWRTRGGEVPRFALPELALALGQVEAGDDLELDELLAIRAALAAARALRELVRGATEELPALARSCDSDPSLDGLAEALGSLEPGAGRGALAAASARLRDQAGLVAAALEALAHADLVGAGVELRESLVRARGTALDPDALARARAFFDPPPAPAERLAYRTPQVAARRAPAPEERVPPPPAPVAPPPPGTARPKGAGAPLDLPKRDEADRPAVGTVTVGMKVFVPRLRTEAQVVEVLGGGQVRVAAGPLKLLTSIDELRSAKAAPGKAPGGGARHDDRARRTAAAPFDAAADPDLPIQTSSNTVDLRGLRAHEAVAMAEQHLDRCLGQGLRVAFLIHGHGTGALRKEIRDAVRTSPYVERSRPGEHGEGGDGVTVVWLR